jgi:uncharacterized protein YkwD
MLNVHNQARFEVGVEALTYDSGLAFVASQWADNCLFQHSGGQYGENLYASTNQASGSDAANGWVSEKQYFLGGVCPNFCSNGFGSCGHYTQIVWRDTTTFGCDYQDCSENSPFGSGNWRLWVCNYNPPGNVVGQAPY